MDTLLAFGSEIKALGDGKVGGYLVRFTSPDMPDLEGDYFSKATDFDAEDGDPVTVYYNHGLDRTMKRRKLGRGALKFDDIGVWVEAQLQMRDAYEQAIYRMVEAGKLGWSSGTLPNLVERESVGKAAHITHWPLGKDASVTPTPAAGPMLTQVQPLKSWAEAMQDEVIPEPDPQPEAVQAAVLVATDAVDDTQQVIEQAATKAAEEIDMSDELTALTEEVKALKAALQAPVNPVPVNVAPVVIKSLGDTEAHALAAWYKKGDTGGVKHMLQPDGGIQIGAIKASNDTDMNIGTAADGGDLVPTGHYQQIIARRNYGMLATQLGLMSIPGRGTTVNVPIDNEADGEFVSTNEVAAYDRDAPAVTKAAMTLVKYTKKVELSVELLDDEDSNLMAFLDDFVGRALAKTHNALLIAEAGNGTKTADFAATSIAAGKIEGMTGNDDLDPYLDDAGGVGWIMRNSTRWALASILGEERVYDGVENTPARRGGDLLGYPVFKTSKAAAIATGTKSVFFGNWRYMGWREAPGLTVLRDPYTLAATGQIRLIYAFRTVYKVLQAQAITYGLHA